MPGARSYFYLCIREFTGESVSAALPDRCFAADWPVGMRKAVAALSGAAGTLAVQGSSRMPPVSYI